MSTTVDQRVVEMRFDNQQFESNVQTSISTLDKLKQSLNLSSAARGLESISSAAKNFTLDGLSTATDAVALKFNALYSIADQSFRRIVDSAWNAGEKIVSALTIDPIKTGFSEYETQINAVQTILANTQSKGTTIDDVNKALDELNEYADKTIYNFTEMTRNIGTFTAAGIDLETSTNAIQGIANLAAVSGSTSQQASTAMYQLSQALSAGTVKLQDWNSVVNAGMGGQVFQDALKETARAHGIAIDDMIAKEGSFRNSLQNGWITSELLTETLQKFTMTTEGLTDAEIELNRELWRSRGYSEEQINGIFELGKTATDAATKVKTFTQLWDTLKESVQSGWTQSWEIIVGDFEEAKALLTEVSNVLGNLLGQSAKTRNELLQGWKDAGGRDSAIEAVRNAFEGILSIAEPIKQAFHEIFPPLTVEQLINFTNKIKDLTSKLKINGEQAAQLKSTFKGLFAGLNIVKTAIVSIWKALNPLVGSFSTLAGKILETTASWGEWVVGLDESIQETGFLTTALTRLSDTLKIISTTLKNVISNMSKMYTEGGEGFSGVLNVIFQSAKEIIKSFFSVVETITGKNLDEMEAKFFQFASNVKSNISDFITFIKDKFNSFNIEEFSLSDGLKKLGEKINSIFNDIYAKFSSFGSKLTESTSEVDFSKLFIGLGSVAGISVILKTLADGFKSLFNGLNIGEKVSGALDKVKGCFQGFQNDLNAGALLKIAGSIAILAGSIFLISIIDSEKMKSSLGLITGLFVDLIASIKMVDKLDGSMSTIIGASVALIALSVAVLILTDALKTITDIQKEQDSLASAIIAVGSLSVILTSLVKSLSKHTKEIVKGTGGLILFAVAIKILASACAELAMLDLGQITIGLGSVSILMMEVSSFIKKSSTLQGDSKGAALGVLLLAVGLKVLASACNDLATLPIEQIGKGLLAITVLLGESGIFLKLTDVVQNATSTGFALIAVAVAMKILASAMQDFASLSDLDFLSGLTIMGLALGEIALAVNVMPANLMETGLGLIMISAAMVILSQAIGSMGKLTPDQILGGLIAMGVALTELAIALNFMKTTLTGSAALVVAAAALNLMVPVIKSLGELSVPTLAKGLIAVAAALLILGVAGTALSPVMVPILALAGALALIGVAVGAVGAGMMAAGIGINTVVLALGTLAAMGTVGATAIVAALGIIVAGIASLIPDVMAKIAEAIIEFQLVILNGIPTVVSAFVEVIKCIAQAIIDTAPVIHDAIMSSITAMLQKIAEYTPAIVQAGYDIILSILQGIANNIPSIIQAGIDIILGFLNGITQKMTDVIQAGYDMLIGFINGITDAINNNTDELIEAMNGLMDALINAALKVLSNSVSRLTEAGGHLITGLMNGLKAGKDAVLNVIRDIAASSLDAIKDFFGIHSPSRVFAEVGRYLDEGLIVGLREYAGGVADEATAVGSTALDAMSESLSNLSGLVDGDMEYTPTIRPVIDLTNVQNGANAINGMLSQEHIASISDAHRRRSQYSYDETQSTASMIDRLSSKLSDQLSAYMGSGSVPVNVHVMLEGDSAKIFKVVQAENNRYIKQTGYSPLAP